MLEVARRAWSVQHINMARPADGPTPEYARLREGELRLIGRARAQLSPSMGWSQRFLWPAHGRVSGVFGAQRIYRGGVPARGIAACIACHGPGGHGNALSAYPRIGGQHSAYVAKTLHEYASGTRRSDAEVNQMMRNVAALLLDDEIKALASYVQGLN